MLMKNSVFLFFLIFFITSCEKKYQRPAEYQVDLFENERNQANQPYIMNEDEAYDASEMVITASDMTVSDSSVGRGKPFYIYRLNSGHLLKTKTDSVIHYPFTFLSNQKLNFENKDSVYIYLQKLSGYRLIAEEKKIKYQWLKAAPVYQVKAEQ